MIDLRGHPLATHYCTYSTDLNKPTNQLLITYIFHLTKRKNVLLTRVSNSAHLSFV